MDPVGRLLRAVAAGAVGLAAACLPSAAPPDRGPSEEAALRHLAEVVTLVRSGDITSLCDLGGPTCKDSLQGSDPRAVPRSAPLLLHAVAVPVAASGDGTSTKPGVLLELCGIDGLGQTYFSDMFVYFDRDRIVSTEPAYWLGFRMETGTDVGGPAPPDGPCPPS